MKILLTGACGTVARAIRRAAGAEHELVCLDLSEKVKEIGGIQADMLDKDAIFAAVEGCQAIIHTAALHGAFRGKASNQEFLRVNLLAAETLFGAALAHGIKRLVMSSTLEVLCGFDWSAYGAVIYTEDLPPRPDWIYPLSKYLVEQMGNIYAHQHQLSVVNLRYAYVREVAMPKIGLGLLARSVADSDVAQANLLAATKPGLGAHVFNIGPYSPLTQKDIVQGLSDPGAVLEKHWPGCTAVLRQHSITPKPDHLWPVCRLDAARAVLGWEPQVTFEKYLLHLGWQQPAGAKT